MIDFQLLKKYFVDLTKTLKTRSVFARAAMPEIS